MNGTIQRCLHEIKSILGISLSEYQISSIKSELEISFKAGMQKGKERSIDRINEYIKKEA